MKLETEVITWVKNYDNDMNEKQDLIDTLNEKYDAEKADLRRLSEFFAKIDRDKANEDEENADALEVVAPEQVKRYRVHLRCPEGQLVRDGSVR